MTDYYKQLGVSSNATQKEIRKVYKRLVLLLHPDKVPGKEAEFKLVQEAYDTLSEPEKRKAYDATLFSFDDSLGHITRLKRQGVNYKIAQNPNQHNHYAYINAVFNLQGSEALVPGQDISDQQHNTYWEMLNYVDFCLCRRKEFLDRVHKPNEHIKKELQLIELNLNKICTVIPVILGCNKRKRLYDLAMGFTQADEMLEIGRLIGGIECLVRHISQQDHINSAEGIFILRKAGYLSPENFKQLSLIDSYSLIAVSMTLVSLFEVNLLTQVNFDCVVKNHKHATAIDKGLGRLELVGILNQKYFDAVVNAGKESDSVGSDLEGLKIVGLLNDENLKVITQRGLTNNIWPPLQELQDTGQLNQEDTSAVLLWKGPEKFHLLNHRIDQMIAHGVYLLSQDVDKGKSALLLGLELKKDLKIFFENSTGEQNEIAFKQSFMNKLHSRDNDMSIHRALWKIIVANIAIAFTGVGLIALGIHYAVKGQVFFATTKREQLIENIAESNWPTI